MTMPRRSFTAQASVHPLHAAAFTFVVASDIPAPLTEMNRTVRAFLAAPNRTEHDRHSVQLIIEEWATNLRKHGCADGGRHIATLTLKNFGYSVSIRLEDDCAPFDPTALPTPDLERGVEERPVGGLGVHLIRSMVEQFTYRHENGKNIWEMVRRIDRP